MILSCRFAVQVDLSLGLQFLPGYSVKLPAEAAGSAYSPAGTNPRS